MKKVTFICRMCGYEMGIEEIGNHFLDHHLEAFKTVIRKIKINTMEVEE